MTLLDLVNRLRVEVGASGPSLTTLSGTSAETTAMRNWIIQADMEIQESEPRWNFLRTEATFNTIAGTNNYSIDACNATDLSEWRSGSFRCYLTSAGYGSEVFLSEMDYTGFRDYYLFNARRTTLSRPITVAIGPDKSLWFGLVPDATYTVIGEYYKVPTAMDADGSTTAIPTRFQMAIVYKAMMSYGAFEAAPEVLAYGERKYREIMSNLRFNQLESPMVGGALA